MGKTDDDDVPIILATGFNIPWFKNNYRHLPIPIVSEDILLTSVNSSPLTVIGKVFVMFRIQDASYSRAVNLIQNFECDLLANNNVIIYFNYSSVQFGRNKCHIQGFTITKISQCKKTTEKIVCLVKDVIFEPQKRSETLR